MSQRQAACKLNVSQRLPDRMWKSRREIGNASPANESSDRKSEKDRYRIGSRGYFETVARESETKRRLRAEELANKNDFVRVCLYRFVFFFYPFRLIDSFG